MTLAQSSQGFVRALKAASDPPQPGGLQKIDIARQAWDDATFYVPSKAEVIANWILTRLLKDKTNDSRMNPVLDLRLWTLLSDVISTPSLSPAVINSRSVKAWLVTLLNRIPIAPIIISFLNILATLESEYRENLTLVVRRCLVVIWPLGVHKLGADVLLDCFGAFHGVLEQCETDESLAHIGLFITSSFRTSLGNASNKKKLYLTFIQSHLRNWMECVLVKPSCSIYGTLVQNSHTAGVETLFNLDILRQIIDIKSENTLLDAFKNISVTFHKGLVLAVLPSIFASFLQCIKTFRSSLFSQGSNQSGAVTEEVRAAGMRFFVSCQCLLHEAGSNDQTWSTRVALLTLVDKENLFSYHQSDAELILKQNVELAIPVLSCGWNTDQIKVTILAVECLSALTRIDYDLIAPFISRILPQLLLVSEPNKPFFAFLDLLLNYHTKTRTMHTYLISLLTALSSDHLSAFSGGSRQVYQLSSSGALLHPIHLDRLGKCIQGFLTSSQTVATVHRVLQSLKEGWEQFHFAEAQLLSDGGQGSRKRRKVEAKAENIVDSEFLAVTFSLSARMVCVVLSSLPVRSVPEATRGEIQSLLDEARRTLLHIALTKTLKAIQKQNRIDIWASQIVAAAILRLQDALNTSRHVTVPRHHNSKLSVEMMNIVEDDGILPELSLEIFRSLLSSSAEGDLDDPHAALLRILEYLDRNLKVPDVTLPGLPYHLTVGEQGKRECASALLHMIIDKWLPAFDALASGPQLEKLVQFIYDPITLPPALELRGNWLFIHALRSAQSWELPKLRDALLTFINKETSTVDRVDLSRPKAHDSHRILIQINKVRRVVSAFEMLLFVPIEYISRTIRTDLVKRALTADIFITNLAIDEDNSAGYVYHSLTILRVFVKRIFVSLGCIDQSIRSMCQFLEHALNASQPLSQPTQEFCSVTLDLVELHFSALFKSSEKSSAQAILEMMHSFSECNMFKPSSMDSPQADIRLLSFMRMIDLLETDFSPSNFAEEVQAVMRGLHNHLLSALLPLISAVIDQTATDMTNGQHGLLTLWRHTLSFGRWLGLKLMNSRFGQRLASKIVASSAISPLPKSDLWDDICVTSLAILLQELHYCSHHDRFSHLDVTEAVYISFPQTIGSNGRTQMDDHISKACKVLSVSDFSHMLEFTFKSLSDLDHSPRDLTYLAHLSVLLLHDHPHSTLKHIQAFTTKCINMFASRPVFTLGPLPLRLQVLSFVKQHCSDRPAALRLIDLGSVWSLLSKLLTRSVAHDETTSTIVFHEIIAIISALIRLRRDLVSLTLPHLGMVLRQLMMSIRSPRPHLGGKQSTFVTDTLPRWVDVKQPLGAEEGKALARLFETLTTKSIVRTHTSAETQRAESLAKPFSKHAAYVLKAYIDVMNDPLCILPSELRKEIQPGLFSLCRMLTDHSRDAMMVSALDAGGKVTMKTLWREYEKQRYIGRG